MAAGLTVRPLLALLLVVGVAVAGCTSIDRPRVQPEEVALPTPMRSVGASMATTLAALERALADRGERLVPPAGAYRPAEPASLLQLPRIVRRAQLADIDDGYVVIYQAADRSAAGARAQELAAYLESGFGQANYSADTQFSVGVLGDTVVFTTFSSARSDDPERARAVFDAVATVGEPVPVDK